MNPSEHPILSVSLHSKGESVRRIDASLPQGHCRTLPLAYWLGRLTANFSGIPFRSGREHFSIRGKYRVWENGRWHRRTEVWFNLFLKCSYLIMNRSFRKCINEAETTKSGQSWFLPFSTTAIARGNDKYSVICHRMNIYIKRQQIGSFFFCAPVYACLSVLQLITKGNRR